MTIGTPRDAGFTLVEALVAMAVLAVAGAGLVRATQGHIDTVAALEARVAGGWAADNALAEARLGLVPAAGPLLARDWHVSVAAHASDDPAVAALTVSAASGATRVVLHGFRDTAAAAGEASAAGEAPAAGGGPPAKGPDAPATGDAVPGTGGIPVAAGGAPPAAGDAPLAAASAAPAAGDRR